MVDCLGDETIAAYVDGVLAIDATLRVDRHIDSCTSCRKQLSAVAASPVMHSFVVDLGESSPAPEVFETLATGRPGEALQGLAIGRYLVERVIGRGGMGVVVRARDPELQRAIAIKLVDPASREAGEIRADSGVWRSRLRAEARAMARLRHPNVVAVYDAGAFGDQMFVAMELVEGESLARYLERGRDPLAHCVAAGRGLCAAHAAGLVHGDVKPDNILIDCDGRALVGDFGLAQAIAARSVGDGRPVWIGTPAYMAPELLRGQPATPATDQFAFAVTLYEAYAGRRPWRAVSIDTLLHAVEHEELERPRAMSRSVWRVATRALSIDPADRYASMQDLVDDLERAAPARRRRVVWLGGASAALAGIACVAVVASAHDATPSCVDPIGAARAMTSSTLCGSSPSQPCTALTAELASAATQWRETHLGVCKATRTGQQSPQLLDRRMHCLDQRRLEQTALIERLATPLANGDAFDAIAALRRLDPASSCATYDGSNLPIPPASAGAVSEADGWIALAKVDYDLGHYQAGLDALVPHVAAIEAIGYAPSVAAALTILGELEMERGDLAGAERAFDRALRASAEAGDDAATANVLLSLVHLQGNLRQQLSRGDELVRAADAAVVRAGKPPKLEAKLLSERGLLETQTGELAAARADFERAVELRRQYASPTDTAIALQHLCNVENLAGEVAGGRAHCAEAVQLLQGALGADHPLVAEAEVNLGVSIASSGDVAAAQHQWQAALATLERGLGDDSPSLSTVLVDLVDAARLLGDDAAADRYLERAVKVSGHLASTADGIDVEELVANKLRENGKLVEATARLEPIARRAEVVLGLQHPTTVRVLEDLGTTYYLAGRFGEAKASYDKALTAASQLYGAQSPASLALQLKYGEALLMMNDDKTACPVFERAMLGLEATVKADAPEQAEADTNFAICSTAIGNAARAIGPAQKGLAIREQRGDNPMQTAQARFTLGDALWRARRDPTAVAMVRKARDELRALPPGAPLLPDVEHWLAGDR